MIKYNVTVKIEEKLSEEWLSWMKRKHVPDVMATGLFENCSINELSYPKDEEGRTFSIQYHCINEDNLNEYFDNHAQVLQQEHADRYRNKYVAFRTILREISTF